MIYRSHLTACQWREGLRERLQRTIQILAEVVEHYEEDIHPQDRDHIQEYLDEIQGFLADEERAR